MTVVKSQFWEDNEKNIRFLYTGKANIIGRDYADAVISNSRNAHYIRFATISYDESLQSSEENIVNEELLLRVENYIGSQYVANSVTVKLIGQIVGKRVNKNKFKCIVTPEIDYLTIPKIIVTEELNSDGNRIGLWLQSDKIKRIYISKLHSHARNSYPLNTEYIDSKYYIELLNNEDMVYDVDTSNVSVNVTKNQFAAGVNIFSTLDHRVRTLEAVVYPDFNFATINTESSWVPETTGSAATGYQRIPMINADYGNSLSTPFLRIQTGNVSGFTVNDTGTYSVQYTNGLNTRSAVADSDAELALFKNDERIQCTSMEFKLKADNGVQHMNPIGASSGTAILSLTPSDIVRLEFKFLGTANNGVVNDGCRILVTKLLHTPQ